MRARIISATGAVAAAALCALTVGGVAGAAAYPGNGLPPGTVTPPAITPAFTFTPTIQNAIFGVFDHVPLSGVTSAAASSTLRGS